MNSTLKGEVKKYIEQVVQHELEKYMKLYSKEELLTKTEFLKAMEIIQQRFEATDKRFETMDKRFETMDKRFETMDKRFEAVLETMNRGFLTLQASIDSLGRRSGVRLEKTILTLMQKALINRDININEIQWIELQDEHGEVFTKNYRTDVDVLLKDGFHFLMEIKYHPDNRDVFHFLKVAELYTKQYQYPNKLLLVALEIDPQTREFAEANHIEVITGESE